MDFSFSLDVVSHSKYHCTHVSGLHAVAIPFIQALEENNDPSKCFRNLDLKIKHLVCIKTVFIIIILKILLSILAKSIACTILKICVSLI